jgi:hypothetical protein
MCICRRRRSLGVVASSIKNPSPCNPAFSSSSTLPPHFLDCPSPWNLRGQRTPGPFALNLLIAYNSSTNFATDYHNIESGTPGKRLDSRSYNIGQPLTDVILCYFSIPLSTREKPWKLLYSFCFFLLILQCT